MSPAARKFYFQLWSGVCRAKGWTNTEANRRAFHAECRCPASSRDWSNAHFDRYKATARAVISGVNTGNTPVYDEAGERRRIVWRIEYDLKKAGLPETYVGTIITDQAGLACWRLLDLDTLRNLRMTIHNRAHRKINPDAERRGTRDKSKRKPARRTGPQLNKTTRSGPISSEIESSEIECPF